MEINHIKVKRYLYNKISSANSFISTTAVGTKARSDSEKMKEASCQVRRPQLPFLHQKRVCGFLFNVCIESMITCHKQQLSIRTDFSVHRHTNDIELNELMNSFLRQDCPRHLDPHHCCLHLEGNGAGHSTCASVLPYFLNFFRPLSTQYKLLFVFLEYFHAYFPDSTITYFSVSVSHISRFL